MKNIKNQSFPVHSIDEWKKKAEQSLKGKSVDSLQSSTYEDIVLKPLYSRSDEQLVSEYPGGSDFRRGSNLLGYVTNPWKAAQRLSYQTPDELQEKLQQSLTNSQSVISFEVTKGLLDADDTVKKIVEELYDKYPFAINAKAWQNDFLKVIESIVEKKESHDEISGYVGADPIAIFAEEGKISADLFIDWQNTILKSNLKFPNLRTVLIDTVPYHNGGANAVQELGIALAEGVYYLDQLQDAGMSLEDICSKMIFQFSIGGQFFMEIAKLRAARVLWNRITKVYGADAESCSMRISAETSSFTKTVYDPHVNLLRAGNEAFAAVIGGVQFLHVSPFDDLTGSSLFSERIARNTQLLLKEEAHLQKVIDPSGGSWFVEQLTNQLAEAAWVYFQKIEAKGGILEVLKSNWLQQEIDVVYKKRIQDVQTRKQSIVGTNVYANLDETVPVESRKKKDSYIAEELVIPISPVQKRRLAEPFEELRSKAMQLSEKYGQEPSVGMICLGELKQYKTRLDFMKGFLTAGGLKASESGPVFSIEDAKQFISERPNKYFCLCGSNDQYESVGFEYLTVLKSEFPDRIFYLAGLPEKEKRDKWIDSGIQQFIHLKSNCYNELREILQNLEVSTIEEETKA